MDRIFNEIYQKTLALKQSIANRGTYRRITIPDNALNKTDWLNLSASKKRPLFNTTVFSIYDDVFRDIMINKLYPIAFRQVYTLLDFMSASRTYIGVSSNGVVIDPSLCQIYMPSRGKLVVRAPGNLTNITVVVVKNILTVTRYTMNTTVTLTTSSPNAYWLVVNGIVKAATPTLVNGSYQITVSAAGGWATLIASENIRTYTVTPSTNSKYNYVNFPSEMAFADLSNMMFFRPNTNTFINPTAYTPLVNGVTLPDTNVSILRVVGVDTVAYEDLRTTYAGYKDYMAQYLSDSLPSAISSFTPYTPTVSWDTSPTEFQNQMITAMADFTDFYRKYLESQYSIGMTTNTMSVITKTFLRNSIALMNSWQTSRAINEPRFRTVNGNMGMLVEEAVSNMIADPLFSNGIQADYSTTAWSVPYQDQVNTATSITSGVLYHYGRTYGVKSVRLNSPQLTFVKSLAYTIQYKIKYGQLVGSHALKITGPVVDNEPSATKDLTSYLSSTYTDSNGFQYYEYRIPASAFSGSGTTGYIGLWSNWNAVESIEYQLKDFQVTQSTRGLPFYPGSRASESFALVTTDSLQLSAGSLGLWYTPTCLGTTAYVLDSNIYSSTTPQFALTLGSTGVLTVQYGSASKSTAASAIKVGSLYYIALSWVGGVCSFYLNGTLIGTATGTFASGAALSTLWLGSSKDGTAQANGVFHDIRLSKTARTAAEITASYTTGMPLPVDSATSYKLAFDGDMLTPIELAHPTSIVVKRNPYEMLFFNDGLNVSPAMVTRDASGQYTAKFREREITASTLITVDTGRVREPYVSATHLTSQEWIVGPSSKLNSDSKFVLYETGLDTTSIVYGGTVTAMATGLDGSLFVAYSTGKVVRMNPYTMTIEAESAAYGGSVNAMVVGGDGKVYIGGDTVFTIKRLNPDTLTVEAQSSSMGGVITGLVLASDGNLLLIGGTTNVNLKKINISTFAQMAQSTNYVGGIYAATVGTDGKVYIGGVATQKIWRLNASTLAKELESPEAAMKVNALATGKNGFIYAVGDDSQTVKCFNASTLVKTVESVNYGGTLTKVYVGLDGAVYAVGNTVNRIVRYAPVTLDQEYRSRAYGGVISALVNTADTSLFAGGEATLPVTKFNTLTLIAVKKRQFTKLTDFTYTMDKDLAKLALPSGYVGKNVHVMTTGFNKLVNETYSTNGLVKLPSWAGFVSTGNIFTFLKGRLLPYERQYVFNPFQYTLMKGETALAVDLDTDVVTGETFNILLSDRFVMAEHNLTLTNGQKIIELTDKTFPFSNKTHLVFIDGKLISPSNVKVIDNYRFSVTANSIKSLCIIRRAFDIAPANLLAGLLDKWSQYLATLSTANLEALIGSLNAVSAIEDNTRSVYLGERHYFEVLYNYCLKERRELTIEDHLVIPVELPGVLTEDGRIPISSLRSGTPRYPL